MRIQATVLRILIAVVGFGFFSCEILNPKVDIPSYISIPSFSLITDPLTEGTNNNKITDVWVYVDDVLVGTFEVPAKFPVLKEGSHVVEIKAGVQLNGISTTRLEYPFFDGHTTTVQLNPNTETVITPVFKYNKNTVFKWMENFENIGMSLTEGANSISKLKLLSNSNEVFEGNKCAYVEMDQTNNFFEISTKEEYELPKDGASVILEMNYKNNEEMLVGIYANSASTVEQKLALKLRPTIDDNGNLYWNKIYINLTSVVSSSTDATTFKVFFGGTLRDKPDVSKAVYYIDNIKLTHR